MILEPAIELEIFLILDVHVLKFQLQLDNGHGYGILWYFALRNFYTDHDALQQNHLLNRVH